MRDDNPNWFSNWEEELPSPEELIPLSQTLISPHLALAFEIGTPNHHLSKNTSSIYHQRLQSTTPSPKSADFAVDSTDLVTGGEEQARTLKRPRLVWTPQLHKRFVDAVAHLGIKNAVPKTIMLLMSVDGLTRENVASHLQKYRLYLRRMQGFSGNGNGVVSDSSTDRLFASSPVPAHFLSPVKVNSEHFMPEFQHHHQFRQPKFIGAPPPPPLLQQQQQSRVEYPYVGRYRETNEVVRNLRFEDSKSVNGDNAREILTLFPTGN